MSGIKHVLKLCKCFDTNRQRFLRSWFIFGNEFQGIVRVDILQPKTVAIGYTKWFGESTRTLDDFFEFHSVFQLSEGWQDFNRADQEKTLSFLTAFLPGSELP
jgi:hypothetical protein